MPGGFKFERNLIQLLLFFVEMPMLWNDYCHKLLRLQELMVAVSAIGIAFTASGAITIACSQSWMGSNQTETLVVQARFLVISTIIFMFSMVSAWLARILRLIVYGDGGDTSQSPTHGAGYDDKEETDPDTLIPKLYQRRIRMILTKTERRTLSGSEKSPLGHTWRWKTVCELAKLLFFWCLDMWAFHLNLNVLLGPIAGILVALYPLASMIDLSLEWLMLGLLLVPAGVTTTFVFFKVVHAHYDKMRKKDEESENLLISGMEIGHRMRQNHSRSPSRSMPVLAHTGDAMAGEEKLLEAIDRLTRVIATLQALPLPNRAEA